MSFLLHWSLPIIAVPQFYPYSEEEPTDTRQGKHVTWQSYDTISHSFFHRMWTCFGISFRYVPRPRTKSHSCSATVGSQTGTVTWTGMDLTPSNWSTKMALQSTASSITRWSSCVSYCVPPDCGSQHRCCCQLPNRRVLTCFIFVGTQIHSKVTMIRESQCVALIIV